MFAERILAEFLVKSSSTDESRLPKSVGQRQPVQKNRLARPCDYVALLLALYIAFWLGLDDPRWSFLTVFVVAQPDSGPRSGQKFLPHSRYHRRAVRCDCARVYPSPIRRALFNRRRNLDLLLQLCRPGGA